ncbi:MAG: hypothetical protein ABF913_04825 [Oenococcus sp.]|uniref:hypothetical protein n=1 Tax=Oenococcus sp. TaxID=1979414 RepID=UPI0039EA6946
MAVSYHDIKEMISDAKKLAKGINDSELNSKLMDLQGTVLDLLAENSDLRDENKELKKDRFNEDNLKKVGDFWKLPNRDYFYCPRCWGKDHKLIPCNDYEPAQGIKALICPVCNYWTDKPKSTD